jgi:serine phosphatase RsbU (regulator of sigma subunit)
MYFERIGHKTILALIFLVISLNVYSQLPSVPLRPADQAKVEEYKQQIKKYQQLNNNFEQTKYLNLLGNLYWTNGSMAEAVDYFKQSIQVNQQIGNKNAIKALNNNLGIIYSEAGNYVSALEHFKVSLSLNRSMNRKADVAFDLMNIGLTQQNMQRYEESNKSLDEAIALSKELNDLRTLKTCYSLMAENFDKLGNSSKSMEFYGLFSTIQKHLQQEELEKADARTRTAEAEKMAKEAQLQNTYDTLNQVIQVSTERQMQIELLNKDNELKAMALKEEKSRLRSVRLLSYSLVGGIIFLLVIAGLIFIQFHNKKKANLLLEEKNQEISRQKQKIDDSIHYAHRIQKAVLIPRHDVLEKFPEHFIYFKPREIVSGDFFWVSEKGSKIFIAAVDCTGHGVPGAFMSMLGISYLNEIVSSLPGDSKVEAGDFLNRLRKQIIYSLHQSGVRRESKDGMDISLIVFDTESLKIEYAGAHNALYLIRNDELIQYEADRMPISIHRLADRPFTNHEINLKKGDSIYIFTDGFADQVGGQQGRKFLSRNFKQMIFENHKKPMAEQSKILEKTMEEWCLNHDQRDDMLVMGIRF